MFIIDFDDTIFDTQTYKRMRMESLFDLGISIEEYQKSYDNSRLDQNGNFIYTDEHHAHVLESVGYNYDEVLERFEKINIKINTLLCKDTKEFLHFLQTYKTPIILLSMGAPKFQKMKVDNSGIGDMFDEIIFLPKSKVHVVRDIVKKYKDEDIWFINDKVNENIEVQEAVKNIHVLSKISIQFPVKDYIKSKIPHFANLFEIKNYIIHEYEK
jgi:FMN phosphatase YigB (HAD superfamily)